MNRKGNFKRQRKNAFKKKLEDKGRSFIRRKLKK